MGTRPVLTGFLSGMGSVICGGGLAFDVTVAYEKPPGAGVAETMDGVELVEVVVRLSIERHTESTAGGVDSARVVPFHVVRLRVFHRQ